MPSGRRTEFDHHVILLDRHLPSFGDERPLGQSVPGIGRGWVVSRMFCRTGSDGNIFRFGTASRDCFP
jgi:hypothetical protein